MAAARYDGVRMGNMGYPDATMAGVSELKAGFAPPAVEADTMTEAEAAASAALAATLETQLRTLVRQLAEIEALYTPPH